MTRRKMPRQKPGKSKQDVETPEDLLSAIKRRWRFTSFDCDLAAESEKISKGLIYIGPEQDSLVAAWPLYGMNWLNPEFGQITDFSARCAHWTRSPKRDDRSRLFLLVPASVGTHWFWRHCFPHALNLALQPRVTFVGHEHAFPKDLMLSVFGETPGFGRWRWK